MDVQIDKVVECDVLSVGGSGAGVTAAVAASKNGARVVLVSKGKVGNSGNVIMGGAGFCVDGKSAYEICGLKEADISDTKERMFDSIVKESYYLSDQNLVEQYVEESPQIVNEVLQWGARAGQKFVFLPPNFWFTSGLSLAKSLKQGIKENPGIELWEDVMILDLLTEDNRITGAVGMDIYSGELILFKTRAVVLGTGGYQPFPFKNTVADMTGDGVAMAYRAGAEISDMEFLLCFPTALEPPEMSGSIYPFVFQMLFNNVQPIVKDGDGNVIEIPQRVAAMAKGTKLSKLLSTYYWGYRIAEGKGTPNGGVYWDYSNHTKEDIEKAFQSFFRTVALWYKPGHYQGDNLDSIKNKILNKEPIEVGLGYEYSNGGIVVDEKMRTRVAGLFAAGEVTSGVFGACRVGDGLIEMLVQGSRAGASAAEYANNAEKSGVNQEKLDSIIVQVLKPFEQKNGFSGIAVMKNIEKAADAGFGFNRNEKELNGALEAILRIKKEELPNLSVKSNCRKYNYEWLCAWQAKNLLLCVEAGIKAALTRKESRGCHIRSDYPEVDHDRWLVKIIIHDDQGDMCISTRKPIVTTMPLPTGKEPTIVDYFLNENLNYKRKSR